MRASIQKVAAKIVLLLLMIAGGAIGAVALTVSWTIVERLSATAHSGNIWKPWRFQTWDHGELSVWVYTPHVAPGDELVVDVGVYGGLRAAIDRIDGSFGGEPFTRNGKGPDWGMIVIDSKRFPSKGRALGGLRLRVPADAKPGGPLELQLQVHHTLAVPRLKGFVNEERVACLTLPIHIQSPAEAVACRWLSAGRALLAFVLALFLGRWLVSALRAGEGSEWKSGWFAKAFFCGGGLCVLIAFAYIGYLTFVMPLLKAAGWRADVMDKLLAAGWLVGLPLLIWRFPAGRRAKQGEPLQLPLHAETPQPKPNDADDRYAPLFNEKPKPRSESTFSRLPRWEDRAQLRRS
jgi:hypothetical protein